MSTWVKGRKGVVPAQVYKTLAMCRLKASGRTPSTSSTKKAAPHHAGIQMMLAKSRLTTIRNESRSGLPEKYDLIELGGKRRTVYRSDVAEARSKKAARLKALRRKAGESRSHAPGTVTELETHHLHVDAQRFQYKIGAGKNGSVGSLAGVKRYDPELAGVVQVWHDPADGKVYVVNGHNRAELAKTHGVKKIAVRFLDAEDAGQARAKGAITNIAEGRGTSIDAAKFFRETGVTKEHLADRGVALRDHVASEGLALSKLHPTLFRRVVDGDISPERGAVIGGSGLEHHEQAALQKLIDKLPRSREVSNATLKELTDTVRSSASKTVQSFDLFGDNADETSLALHKARLQAHIKSRLGTEKRLFGIVSKSKAAENLERVGNTIDRVASDRVSREAGTTLDVFDKLKHLSGPVSKHLNNAAERLHNGEKFDKV